MSRALVAAALLCGWAAPVRAAAPSVTITGHGESAQMVFAFPRHVGFGLQRSGDSLVLRFTKAGPLPMAAGDAPYGAALHMDAGAVTIDLVPGARVRSHRTGNSIVVELQGPPGGMPVRVPPSAPDAVMPPALSPSAPVVTAAIPAHPDPAPPNPAPPDPASPDPAPIPAPAAAAAPDAPPPPAVTHAAAAEPPPGVIGSAALLPLNSRVGAAAFRRHGAAWLVFDERAQIDFTALQDNPLFARAVVQTLAAALLIRLPLEEGGELRLTHSEAGWTILATPAAPPASAIGIVTKPTQFELTAPEPSQVVTVPDSETGQNLLVGTLHGPAASLPLGRRVPSFMLEPTWLGVAVEPLSDAVTLQTTPTGFLLDGGGRPLSPEPDASRALAAAAFLTRRFDIPAGPPDALMRRLQVQVNEAGEAPAQSRGRPRKAAATTMIALGMGIEAQGMLKLAAEEDPRLVADPDMSGLSAIAAMIGGRESETAGINDPALGGSDEVAFWRAVRAAQMQEGSAQAAPVFAATLNLLLTYPPPLRDPLLPLVAETMALGGAPAAADALLEQQPDNAALDLARAIRLEARGSTGQALTLYDGIAASRPRRPAARAALRATTLRLQTGMITAAAAAALFEQQFFNWRGDRTELALRLRVADLRAQTGAWRPAFNLLTETEQLYPDDTAVIHARMVELMGQLITGPAAAAITPLELVALCEENAELVANIGSPQATALMANKLLALDLPRRAGPVLDRMMRAAPIGPTQATLGLRLATLKLGEGDIPGASAALASSNAPGLPPELIERRGLVAARLAARSGHTATATAILSSIGSQAADDLRASLLSDAQDWQGAAAALADLVAKTVPPDGALTAQQQDTVLRYASALSRAGDVAGLRALGALQAARIQAPRAEMFQLLTAAPVNNVGDLPRSAAELSAAKAIPVGLSAIGSR